MGDRNTLAVADMDERQPSTSEGSRAEKRGGRRFPGGCKGGRVGTMDTGRTRRGPTNGVGRADRTFDSLCAESRESGQVGCVIGI